MLIKYNWHGSRSFPIETGTMQGDAPSPAIFNINEQILLFKIEFDPEVASVFHNYMVPRPVFEATEINFANEANRESNKVDAYADDTTGCTLTESNSLIAIKNSLLNFGQISGLKCNFDKTNILAVGDRSAVTQEILSIGIPFVEKVTILGLEIDHELAFLGNIHVKTVEKIRQTANFWSRFKLSLPGRIGIAKGLMLSQINYFGCIITPSQDQIREMQNIMDNFIVGIEGL